MLTLGGCSSVRLAYNQSDTLVYWWVDRHASLTAEQKPMVKSALLELQRWHRSHQLPDYIAMAQRLRAMAERDITPAEVCAVGQEAQASYQRLLAQVEPDATRLLIQLQPSQLQSIRKRYDTTNEEWREEWLDGPAERRLRRRIELAEGRFEDFYGRLESAQRTVIQQWLSGSGYDPQLTYGERQRRQADSLQTFERIMQSGHAGAASQALLRVGRTGVSIA